MITIFKSIFILTTQSQSSNQEKSLIDQLRYFSSLSMTSYLKFFHFILFVRFLEMNEPHDDNDVRRNRVTKVIIKVLQEVIAFHAEPEIVLIHYWEFSFTFTLSIDKHQIFQ